eukprot:UN07897
MCILSHWGSNVITLQILRVKSMDYQLSNAVSHAFSRVFDAKIHHIE